MNKIKTILYPRNITFEDTYRIASMYSENDDIVYISQTGEGTVIRKGTVVTNQGQHVLVSQQEPYGKTEYRVHAASILTNEGLPEFSMTYDVLKIRYRFDCSVKDERIQFTITDMKDVSEKAIQYFVSEKAIQK